VEFLDRNTEYDIVLQILEVVVTDEEVELLEKFRKLTPDNKQMVLTNIKLFVEMENPVRKAVDARPCRTEVSNDAG
jgi:hypothetical protein